MIPLVRLKRHSFMNMLSINVVELSVILVGLSISGQRPKLSILDHVQVGKMFCDRFP